MGLEFDKSRPARGAWIETQFFFEKALTEKSRPARGAWIETLRTCGCILRISVAPRTGRVD